eukprot:jgi/Psemu1/47528/gm1.47528_g
MTPPLQHLRKYYTAFPVRFTYNTYTIHINHAHFQILQQPLPIPAMSGAATTHWLSPVPDIRQIDRQTDRQTYTSQPVQTDLPSTTQSEPPAPQAFCHYCQPPATTMTTWHQPTLTDTQMCSSHPLPNVVTPLCTINNPPPNLTLHLARSTPTNQFFAFTPPLTISMPITDLLPLQTMCISTGHLTSYTSMPPPNTAAIDTAHQTFLQTIGSPCNDTVQSILQTTPKILFLYIDAHSTIHSTHSLVPWTDPTGTIYLVGTHTGSIQAEALVSLPSKAFNAFTGTAFLPNNFVSATDPASQVSSNPLDHNGSADTMPQFLLVPLLWPTTLNIPAGHPLLGSPLPDGNYDVVGFTTWLAPIHFFTTKNQGFTFHT